MEPWSLPWIQSTYGCLPTIQLVIRFRTPGIEPRYRINARNKQPPELNAASIDIATIHQRPTEAKLHVRKTPDAGPTFSICQTTKRSAPTLHSLCSHKTNTTHPIQLSLVKTTRIRTTHRFRIYRVGSNSNREAAIVYPPRISSRRYNLITDQLDGGILG